jgi:hypothetical protein
MSIPEVTEENYHDMVRELSKPIIISDRLEILICLGIFEFEIGKKDSALDRFEYTLSIARTYNFHDDVVEKISELISKIKTKQSK